jgi:hypothetical protein
MKARRREWWAGVPNRGATKDFGQIAQNPQAETKNTLKTKDLIAHFGHFAQN